MHKRKHITRAEGGGTIKGGAVRDLGRGKGAFAPVEPRGSTSEQPVQQQEATPVETTYERQMRLMREIGENDRVILAALAK